MIKILLVVLFLCSCDSEVKYRDLSQSSDSTKVSLFNNLTFNPQIEMMIVFLWPKSLGPKDESEVIDIITTSRKISESKAQYLEDLYKLDHQYALNNCDCHTFGLCEDDVEMDDSLVMECEDISLKIDENNLVLANLTLDHNTIKEKLSTIGAINIDVGVDEDYLDIGTYDLTSKNLHLNKFGFSGQTSSVDFKVIPYNSLNMKAKFEFSIHGEDFFGDLGISTQKHNIIFSGEIETKSGQRGLIYWEHLK